MSTLETAIEKYQAGDFPGTVEICKELVSCEPENGFLRGLLGNALSCLGQHDEAIAELLAALETDPNRSRAHHNLGSAYQAAEMLAEACVQFRLAHEQDPANIDSLVCLSMALRDAKQWQEAIAAFARLRVHLNGDASYWLEYGKVCLGAADFSLAAECFGKVRQLEPNAFGLDYQLGLAELGLQHHENALRHFRAAAEEAPTEPGPHLMIGYCLAQQGSFESAIVELERALRLGPPDAQALNLKGYAHYRLNQLEEAKAAFARAYQISPSDPILLRNIAELMINTRDYVGATKQLSRGLELHPDHFELLMSMAGLKLYTGDSAGMTDCISRANKQRPSAILEASIDFSLPHIMGTEDEIARCRQHYSAMLEKWADRKPKLQLPDQFFGTSNFFLAYHGQDDRPLLERFSKLCMDSCPDLHFVAEHCERNRREGRIRIGFLSRFLYNHSVSTCFSEIARVLSLTGDFEVHLISEQLPSTAELNSAYPGFAGKTVKVAGDHHSSLKTIAALELDVLIYLDIGMVPSTYFLAHARLARKQCVLGGHPVTTGIPNMDYFISSDLTEVADADRHYSESLIRHPFSTFYFKRPDKLQAQGSKADWRKRFGLPDRDRIYMCPAKLQKIHPSFDLAVDSLLQRDEQSIVVLFEDQFCKVWTKQLQARFEKTIQRSSRDRLKFIPWQSSMADFSLALAAADALLDPFHFGLGTTAVPCYAIGQPIVTLPGEFMRSRPITFFSNVLGIEECVAHDADSYVDTCIQIATNSDLKDSLRRRIHERDHLIYGNLRPIEQLAELIRGIAER